ncbi:MAG: hypothetical protein AAFX76_05920, partial [Planctomycetota bacterium]
TAFKSVTVAFPRRTPARPGDLLTWHLPSAAIRANRLHTPACDDLAAVAAMLSAFEVLTKSRQQTSGGTSGGASGGISGGGGDVRLLCTRAEEIGFVGAIAACKSGLIPPQARLVVLENSKASPDAPLGAGPVVRVGDRTSTFDPALTAAAAQAAQHLATQDPTFRWQRKLMTGGTCEASAYQALGHAATCLCLPLHNYHNMDESRTRIAPESIHLDDYHHLIQLLVHLPSTLDAPGTSATSSPLTQRLDHLYSTHRHLLT